MSLHTPTSTVAPRESIMAEALPWKHAIATCSSYVRKIGNSAIPLSFISHSLTAPICRDAFCTIGCFIHVTVVADECPSITITCIMSFSIISCQTVCTTVQTIVVRCTANLKTKFHCCDTEISSIVLTGTETIVSCEIQFDKYIVYNFRSRIICHCSGIKLYRTLSIHTQGRVSKQWISE